MITALAFNDANAKITNCVNSIGDHLERFVPKVRAFSDVENGEKFQSKASAIVINGLMINALSHNGVYLEREHSENLELLIPFDGFIKVCIGSVSYESIAGLSALMKISDGHKGLSEGNNILIRLDKHKLGTTFSSMLGGNSKSPKFEASKILPIESRNLSFFSLFKSLMMQIDISGCNPSVLEKLAFDDRIYRLAAGLINPHLLISNKPISGKTPQVSIEINRLCEYLRENLRQAAALTEMERISSLSAQQLQYGFMKEFGMNAMEWLINQRLHAARNVLLDKYEQITVDSVAYDFCFASPDEFSRSYLQEFGELPCETIEKKGANII